MLFVPHSVCRSAPLVLLCVAALSACSGPTERAEPQPTTEASQQVGDGALQDTLDPESLAGLRIARFLPSTAPLILEVAEIEAFVEDVELERFAQSHPALFAQLVAVSNHYFGHDIVGVAELQALGIDTTGPIGMALLDAEQHEVGIVYARATDLDAVTAAATAFANSRGATTRTESVSETGATILHMQGGIPTARGWLILRDGWVMAMITPAPDDLALSHVRHLASAEPRRTLSTSNTFRAAVQGLEARTAARSGDSVRAFYNWGALIQGELARLDAESRQSADEDDHAVRQLKEARARGDKANVEYWDQIVRENAEWRQRARTRKLAQRRFLAEVLAPVSSIALQLDVEGAQVRASGFIAIPEETAPLRALLRNEAETARIVHADPTRPAFMAHGHAERATLVGILEAMVRLEDADAPTELREFVTQTFGLDLDSDILPVLTGELGGRVHFARDDQGRLIFDDEKRIEFTVLAGVTSQADATAVLDKVFGHPMLLAFVRRDANAPRWTASVPMYRTLYVELVGDDAPALVVSTSDQAAGRIATRAPLAGDSQLDALLTSQDIAGLLVQDYALFYAVFGAFGDYHGEGAPYDPYPDAPLSAASRQKLTELEVLDAQHRASMQQLQDESKRLTGQMLDALGIVGVTVRAEEGGLGFDGGFYLGADSLATAVGTVGDLVSEVEANEQARHAAWDQHWQQRSTLEAEYADLRYQDWQAMQAGATP